MGIHSWLTPGLVKGTPGRLYFTGQDVSSVGAPNGLLYHTRVRVVGRGLMSGKCTGAARERGVSTHF